MNSGKNFPTFLQLIKTICDKVTGNLVFTKKGRKWQFEIEETDNGENGHKIHRTFSAANGISMQLADQYYDKI